MTPTAPTSAAAHPSFAAGSRATAKGGSAAAVNRDFERPAKLPHPDVGNPPEPFSEHAEGDALDRIQVDDAVPWDGILAWFEHNLTGQATDGRGARSDDRPPEARNGGVA